MRFKQLLKTLAYTLIVIHVWACRSKAPQAQMSDFEPSSKGEPSQTFMVGDQQSEQQGQTQGADQIEQQDLAATSTKLKAGRATLAVDRSVKRLHPKEATAWFTRRLIMTSQQPSAVHVKECEETVESAVQDAANLRALDEISLSLESSVSKNLSIYHWCFYQIMADLDSRLEMEASLMQEKATTFLDRMKILWVLAKALNQSADDRQYLRYLRARYTELSQQVFGRRLETIDTEAFQLSTKQGTKAASEFEE